MRPVLLVLGLFSACTVESSPPAKPAPAVAKAAESPPAKTPEGAMPAKVVDEPPPEPSPEPAPDPASDSKGPGPQSPASDLAQRFRDPPWYRKTLFPDATVASTARSEANDAGLFQSHIVFELKQGTTVEDCAKHLEQKVGESVSNLERAQKPDGRLEIKGSTDRYKVTLLCGEAKGATRAYVAFEWTS